MTVRTEVMCVYDRSMRMYVDALMNARLLCRRLYIRVHMRARPYQNFREIALFPDKSNRDRRSKSLTAVSYRRAQSINKRDPKIIKSAIKEDSYMYVYIYRWARGVLIECN